MTFLVRATCRPHSLRHRGLGSLRSPFPGPFAVWLAICLVIVASSSSMTQTRFVDDAKRDLQLPAKVGRVFAASGPAEVILYTVGPEMLARRNRLPEGPAVEFFPTAYLTPVFIK